MVGHLVIDATDARLGKAIARLRTDGVRLNLNLLGEAVLGEREADRRLEGTRELLATGRRRLRLDQGLVGHRRRTPPGRSRSRSSTSSTGLRRSTSSPRHRANPKFINLDMEEYRDLDLTIAVFTRILEQPELREPRSRDRAAGLPAGRARGDDASCRSGPPRGAPTGGAAIKVRLVKGANLPMEQVEAALHDWPLATWAIKQETDTNYKRVLDYALTPEHIENVRIGVAGHNLFDVAFAWLLAGRRGVRHGIEFEMLLGMAQAQAEVVKRDCRRAAAVHPGRPPCRVRRRDRLPDPPARGGRQPGQLHVRRLRALERRSTLRP